MQLFLINLILMVSWTLISKDYSWQNNVVGFCISFLLLIIIDGLWLKKRYLHKIAILLSFTSYILVEIIRSNFLVAKDVLNFKLTIKPGVISLPIECKTDLEIALLANLITLTPGTLSLAVSADRKFLFLHTMFAKNPNKLRKSIKYNIERCILEIIR